MTGHNRQRCVGFALALLTVAPACGAPGAAPSTVEATPVPGAAIGAFPDVPSGRLPSDTVERLDAALAAAMDPAAAPAVAAAVLVPAQGGWTSAAGVGADGDPLPADAQFSIASITKTVSAAQLLAFAEAGRIELDAPLSDYLPTDVAVDTNHATVRQAMGMRSGIGELDPRGLEQILADHERRWSTSELLAFVGPPIFKAGERVHYNNANYALLHVAIQEISGQSTAETLRAGVLADRGLDRLVFQPDEAPAGPLAPPTVDEGEVPPGLSPPGMEGGYVPSLALASATGAGGAMAADAATLARWGYLLYGGFIIDPDLVAQMTDVSGGYGLGTMRFTENGLDGIGHEGETYGYWTMLYVDRATGAVIVVLLSTTTQPPQVVVARIMEALEP